MKKIFYAIGALIVLLLVVPFLIPKKIYLGWATGAVESRYDVKLKIEDASLAFLPRVAVTLKNVVAAKAEKGEAPLLKADRLRVAIGWTSLLAKQPSLIIGLKNAVAGEDTRIDGDIETDLKPPAAGRPGRLELDSGNLSVSVPGSLAMTGENVSFVSDYEESGSKMELTNGTLKVGPQAFSVSGSRSKSGALDLSLASSDLNLDYLKKIIPGLKGLPPVDGAGLKARYASDGGSRSKPTVSGEVNAAKVSLPDQELEAVSGSFVYREPSLKISNLKAKTLGGSLSGGAALSMAPQSESYDFDIDIKNAALKEVSSVGKLLQGRGDLSLKGNGRGFDKDLFVKTLRGNGNLNVREIRIPALEAFSSIASSPVWDLLRSIPGTLDDSGLEALKNLDSKVNDLASAFEIVDGAVQVKRVNLSFPRASASLGGGIGLDKSLNLSGDIALERALVATFVKNPKVLDALTKSGPLSVPIKITGGVSRPVVAPDMGVIRSKLQAALARGVEEKAKETVKKALEEGKLPTKDDLPSQKQIEDFLKKF